MAVALVSTLSLSPQNPNKTLRTSLLENHVCNFNFSFKNHKFPTQRYLLISKSNICLGRIGSVSSKNVSAKPLQTGNYEFSDGVAEVELRIDIGAIGIHSSRDIFVDADETSLVVRVKASGSHITLMETNHLFEKIKPAETIWYIDEDELVVNLKKHDTDLKWPDVMESWESLRIGVLQLLRGTSLYIVGDSTEINQKVASELAAGLGYTPLSTGELLERYTQQSIDSWVIAEGADSVAEAESAVLESLSSHVRAVVATLGGQHGTAGRPDKWRHLHAGFTVWLSESEATDEATLKEEAQRHIQDGSVGYTNADVVVKLGGWESNHAQVAAQACLSALKRLILSDKKLADEATLKEEAQRHIQDGSVGYTNADVVVKLGGWESNHAQVAAQACLSALKRLILSDKKLAGKKSLYIRLGCRGDWPNIKPPGWDPSSGLKPSPER